MRFSHAHKQGAPAPISRAPGWPPAQNPACVSHPDREWGQTGPTCNGESTGFTASRTE